ncbi:sodium:calcium antiporter [Roseomonas sp. E05]|uniref:sodium:calcium antiporter n=1 Tax=Roseomonas sp. E05 TaxID=3046310 RepID=UPI0024BB9023|nr:sodium:calcium antiporter [Roseomonas sp. E05]MDJ0388496.1 sodium:calcium antiporter [Roseomonas sp. E05]
MSWFEFGNNPLWLNITLFLAAAAFVWMAGARLARYADDISDMTGLGTALVGMLLLGGVTSLPEIAVSATAGLSGDAALAVNNLLGGVALQVVIIAIGDAALRRGAISAAIAKPTVLLQGTFCCLLLCGVAAAVTVGDVALVGNLGAWSTGILLTAVLMLAMVSRYKGQGAWRPYPEPEAKEQRDARGETRSLPATIGLTTLVAAVIVVAGFLLARTGEALAAQTGLGSSLMGAVLVGLATSLPEISTVLAAVRLRRYVMAYADIFGTNIIDIALIFLIDAAYGSGLVLNEVGSFSVFAALLGTAVTLIYLAGLIERKDMTLGRLGLDSWVVVAVYLGGVAVLYTLRPEGG